MRNSGFITRSVCRGYRPKQFVSHGGRQRPHLVARLAKERTVARLVIAPSGYGKTSVVLEYAETMFSWRHVIWLNAKSPCFIRDLDDGDIVSECMARDPELKLVVMDDLPHLEAPRAEALSRDVDAFLERGCEVVLICVPSCDCMSAYQRDHVRLGPADLLLDDEEIRERPGGDEQSGRYAQDAPATARIPALAWDNSLEAAFRFVVSALDERLPSDLQLAFCSAFVLHRGVVDDLERVGRIDRALLTEAARDYPHLGYDAEADSFETPLIEAETVLQMIKGRVDTLALYSRFETRAELVSTWVQIALDRGHAERACDIVRKLHPSERRPDWVIAHACELVRHACFLKQLQLIESLDGAPQSTRDRLAAIEALCLRVLGDERAAVRFAKRYAFDERAHEGSQVVSLLITARFGAGELAGRARGALKARASALADQPPGERSRWDWLAVAGAACADGIEHLAAVWENAHAAGANSDALCVIASWAFSLVDEAKATSRPYDAAVLVPIERYVRARLNDLSFEIQEGGFQHPHDGSFDYFVVSAALSMELAHEKGMAYAGGRLESSSLLALRRVEMFMLTQRRQFEFGGMKGRKQFKDQLVAGHAGNKVRPLFVSPDSFHAIPILELHAFGGLDVSIGGLPIDSNHLSRKNARVLLVLLVANRGRDMSRDSIVSAMWPNRSREVGRKNFYTIWSHLVRALTLSDGTCPYLVRHRYGCRIDNRYVQSDIGRLDDICRALQFGRLDFDEWLSIYTEINQVFIHDLLPAESDNPLIEALREDCRTRLIDALVSASSRLVEAGNPQWGIWFARTAVQRGRMREDAYVALMRAQIAYDQRTAAMMTYLECRRALGEELGIDPSPETNALYEKLLGA